VLEGLRVPRGPNRFDRTTPARPPAGKQPVPRHRPARARRAYDAVGIDSSPRCGRREAAVAVTRREVLDPRATAGRRAAVPASRARGGERRARFTPTGGASRPAALKGLTFDPSGVPRAGGAAHRPAAHEGARGARPSRCARFAGSLRERTALVRSRADRVTLLVDHHRLAASVARSYEGDRDETLVEAEAGSGLAARGEDPDRVAVLGRLRVVGARPCRTEARTGGL
jgi:hypothetical protein